MRLWTLHPKYLDAQGLVALWREGLLAQAVLRGRKRGYRQHPQLARFRHSPAPVACIAEYLRAVREEAIGRGYDFAGEKIGRGRRQTSIVVTRGQLRYEWTHLKRKLAIRNPQWFDKLKGVRRPRPNPLFRVVPGGVENWERIPSASRTRKAG